MYPVGVLFGFGFDTASSVALLAISAIAKRGADGSAIPSSEIVILPVRYYLPIILSITEYQWKASVYSWNDSGRLC